MGVGMVAVCPEPVGEAAIGVLAGHGIPSWICGDVAAAGGSGGGQVQMTGHSRP